MTLRTRLVLLGSTCVALALGLLFALAQLHRPDGRQLLPLFAAATGAGIAGAVAAAWTPGAAPPGGRCSAAQAPAASTYRGAAPAPRRPRASARRAALVVLACLVFTAMAVPLSLHLSRWVELEAVLAGWWLVWAVVLTVVARRGAEVVDDHALMIRRPCSPARKTPVNSEIYHPPARPSWWTKFVETMPLPSPFDVDLEALGFLVGLALVLGAALAGAWLLIEVVGPVLFAVAYAGVIRGLRRAADHRGSTLHAGVAGGGWATAYVAPIAVLVWLVHVAAHH